MSRVQLGLLLILILAIGGGGWGWRSNPGGYIWAPNFLIALIALLMLLGIVFV